MAKPVRTAADASSLCHRLDEAMKTNQSTTYELLYWRSSYDAKSWTRYLYVGETMMMIWTVSISIASTMGPLNIHFSDFQKVYNPRVVRGVRIGIAGNDGLTSQ